MSAYPLFTQISPKNTSFDHIELHNPRTLTSTRYHYFECHLLSLVKRITDSILTDKKRFFSFDVEVTFAALAQNVYSSVRLSVYNHIAI